MTVYTLTLPLLWPDQANVPKSKLCYGESCSIKYTKWCESDLLCSDILQQVKKCKKLTPYINIYLQRF